MRKIEDGYSVIMYIIPSLFFVSEFWLCGDLCTIMGKSRGNGRCHFCMIEGIFTRYITDK